MEHEAQKHDLLSKLSHDYIEKIGNSENFSILWYLMHSVAKMCSSGPDQQFFSKWLVFLVMLLPCKKCKGHALTYVSDHPFVVKPNDPRNAFKYTVDFHNSVNVRLGKPVFLESVAWELYTDDLLCKENCGSDGTQSKKDVPKTKFTTVSNTNIPAVTKSKLAAVTPKGVTSKGVMKNINAGKRFLVTRK